MEWAPQAQLLHQVGPSKAAQSTHLEAPLRGFWGRPGVGTHLPELGHGLAGNDLIVVQPGDETESLELTLPLLQLPQNQGPEDLHILMGKGRRMGAGWRG